MEHRQNTDRQKHFSGRDACLVRVDSVSQTFNYFV